MLLALDTSGPLCSAGVYDKTNNQLVVNRSDNIGRGHAEHLMVMISQMLESSQIDWPEFDQIACVTGPGSFTGLRVGLAAARGLALALKCPCLGVSVFEALAEHYGAGHPICVAMDARRNQLWMQNFDRAATPLDEARAVPIDDGLSAIHPGTRHIVGSGALILAKHDDQLTILDDVASPPIETIARFAAKLPSTNSRPKPLYLRAPDAKRQISTAGVQ